MSKLSLSLLKGVKGTIKGAANDATALVRNLTGNGLTREQLLKENAELRKEIEKLNKVIKCGTCANTR